MSAIERCVEALQRCGKMTGPECAIEANLPRGAARKCLTWEVARPPAERRVHVVGWVRSVPNERKYLRAVYAAGPGHNARRPPRLDRNTVVREYMRRCQVRAGVNAFGPIYPQKKARAIVAAILP